MTLRFRIFILYNLLIYNYLKNHFLGLPDRHQAYLHVIEEISYQQPDEDVQTAIQLIGMAASFSISYKRARNLYKQEIWAWAGGIGIGLLYIIFFR